MKSVSDTANDRTGKAKFHHTLRWSESSLRTSGYVRQAWLLLLDEHWDLDTAGRRQSLFLHPVSDTSRFGERFGQVSGNINLSPRGG